jgi:membrane-associated phospholipid phosphatase
MKASVYHDKKKNVRLWISPGSLVTKIFLVALIAFIILLVWVVFVYGKNSFDKNVFDWFAPHITETRTRIMVAVSFFGNHIFLVPANLFLLILFWARKNKPLTIRVAVVSVSSVLLMSFLKSIFHRVRPDNPLVPGITNFSFPSGHSFMSVTFYGLLIWLVAISIANRVLQRLIIVSLLLFILLIGFSRIYLRVHYATDVIAGLSMGFTWLIVSLNLIDGLEVRAAAKRK